MKRFNELTMHQQQQAVTYALKELKHRISEGFISVNRSLVETELREYAREAAELAWYSQPWDQVIDGIASDIAGGDSL